VNPRNECTRPGLTTAKYTRYPKEPIFAKSGKSTYPSSPVVSFPCSPLHPSYPCWFLLFLLVNHSQSASTLFFSREQGTYLRPCIARTPRPLHLSISSKQRDEKPKASKDLGFTKTWNTREKKVSTEVHEYARVTHGPRTHPAREPTRFWSLIKKLDVPAVLPADLSPTSVLSSPVVVAALKPGSHQTTTDGQFLTHPNQRQQPVERTLQQCRLPRRRPACRQLRTTELPSPSLRMSSELRRP